MREEDGVMIFDGFDIDMCIAGVKPDLPEEKIAYVLMSGILAETVVLGSEECAHEELRKMQLETDSQCHISYVELMDMRK